MVDLNKYRVTIANSKFMKWIDKYLHPVKNVLYKIPVIKNILYLLRKLDNKYQNFLEYKFIPIINKIINPFIAFFVKFYTISNGISKINSNSFDENGVKLLVHLNKQSNKFRNLFFIATLMSVSLFLIFTLRGKFTNFKYSDYKNSSGYVASITIDGIIKKDNEIYESLQRIKDNDSIKAVILNVNSPGGSVQPSEKIYNLIREIDQKKPVVVCMESLAASGGYMISVAGRYIFAMKSTITGSIGVYTQSLEIVELANKIGIKMNYIKTSPIKGSPHAFEKISDEVIEMEKKLITEMHDLFKDIVSQRRGITGEDLKFISNGQIFTGVGALKYNLIDAIGSQDDALKWLKDSKLVPEKTKITDILLKNYNDEKGLPLIQTITSNITHSLLSVFKKEVMQNEKQFIY